MTCSGSILTDDGKPLRVPSGDHENFDVVLLAEPSEISCGYLSTEFFVFCNLFLPSQLKQELRQKLKVKFGFTGQ